MGSPCGTVSTHPGQTCGAACSCYFPGNTAVARDNNHNYRTGNAANRLFAGSQKRACRYNATSFS